MVLARIAMRFVRFFFSSRRRHTRFDCDWSSDVCSSDLAHDTPPSRWPVDHPKACQATLDGDSTATLSRSSQNSAVKRAAGAPSTTLWSMRSEERRVGEEGRSRWAPDHSKKKIRTLN